MSQNNKYIKSTNYSFYVHKKKQSKKSPSQLDPLINLYQSMSIFIFMLF